MDFKAPLQDISFLLFRVAGAERLKELAPYAEVDESLMTQVLEEAGKFVESEVAPLQRSGDEIGAKFEAGKVTMPPGYVAAYQKFWQGGWPALACASEDGGQALPWVLEGVLYEMLSGANQGWTMAPALLHGAYECLKHHGSDELKTKYLPQLASGEWLATMALTEAHAGSDLGMVRTRAVPQADSSYRITGEKIFISSGEHDLTPNIVHLVLARLPDAPPGPKGLSLFLVPKVLEDGSRNSAFCDRIEEKMGLHGSATCVMRFDNATGWLIGQEGRGLNAMFVMMNAARLHVALQGVGALASAWQKANAYSIERRQMRAPVRGDTKDAADLISEHPAIRRILDSQRAWIDSLRVLAYKTGIELDVAKHHTDAKQRDKSAQWCSLITPILKTLGTQQGFTGASECLQVFGGHGYIREWGIEQIVRDIRVSMIYEGTNEIQAIDLLIRKVLPDKGAALANTLLAIRGEMDASRDYDASVLRRFAEVRYATTLLCEAAKARPQLPYEVADDYLRMVGLALMAWAWAKISATGNPEYDAAKNAFDTWVLPEYEMRRGIVNKAVAAFNPHAVSA